MADNFSDDLTQLCFPMYQAGNFSATPLIVFTLVFTLLMTTISLVSFMLGLVNNGDQQKDAFEVEVAESDQCHNMAGLSGARSYCHSIAATPYHCRRLNVQRHCRGVREGGAA